LVAASYCLDAITPKRTVAAAEQRAVRPLAAWLSFNIFGESISTLSWVVQGKVGTDK